MENCAKVFSSNITRVENHHKNNLYDLLNIEPAKPLKLDDTKTYTCNYIPKTDKYYIPKRKARLKVKTVRDIRKSFEQDIYTYLITDLETQHNSLFKKIRHGSSRDTNTKTLAKNILRGDTPISRSTWQMLINLNPEHQTHPRQYVLWNGKYIQVNGSFGGRKMICSYDLAHKKLPLQIKKKKNLKQSTSGQKKGLLRNSLAVKFKPGPLGKKEFLDDSHQKYHVGNTELIDLPKPGLDIQPTYGTALESSITNFLYNLREEDGTISRKWAELAVSVLGTFEKSNAVQLNRDCVTFDLIYKYNQNRLLMRRDVDNHFTTAKIIEKDTKITNTKTTEIGVLPEIQDMINKIIDSVEINIIQDKIFTEEQDFRQTPLEDVNAVDIVTNVKDKSKRKFRELDRLDVTVIRLPETKERILTESCGKAHCTLGCICASLEGTYNLRKHCGRVECMFDCKCDFSKIKGGELFTEYPDLIPGLISLDNEINLKLTKEEQKFHQTVIVTEEKRILLKGEKRNWKTSKKYADFYSHMSLKSENQKYQELSIVALKLNCDNIEPWCMVHQLYKCFCKGKFTESCTSVANETIAKEPLSKDSVTHTECLARNSKLTNDDSNLKECVRERTNTVSRNSEDKSLKTSTVPDIVNENGERRISTRNASRMFNKGNLRNSSKRDKEKKYERKSDSESSDFSDLLDDKGIPSCSRTMPYGGRKYSNGYYKNTNYRILEMEKNDKRLQERLAYLNNSTSAEKTDKKITAETTNETTSRLELLCDVDEIFPSSKSSDEDSMIIPTSKRKRLSSETKLVQWLETNYKTYKQRNDLGLFKNSLEPPKFGKVVLHAWDFILKRYRERKNLFLVSNQRPIRIFMAVNIRNPFFENCININDIRFADLHKYPQTVKNLLINATDLKDNFCILRGLSCCWELIGSVTKVNESDEQGGEHQNTSDINVGSSDMDTQDVLYENDRLNESSQIENTTQKDVQSLSIIEKEIESSTESLEDVGSSKWFVMTIENDFTEIRFFRKGFFVKYESIINAISVARLSGKTVRLSSKKCIEQSEVPQFGIYAIPNDSEYCVFVGPYEMEDTLGIETIKTILDVRKLRKTRGFWITTNKIDNLKVVENPLSFMPLTYPQQNKAMSLESHFSANDDIYKNKQEKSAMSESLPSNKAEESKECSPSKKEIKIVKPIKIRKTNGFYHLASDGILKKISLQYPQNISKAVPIVLNTSIGVDNTSLLKPNTISNNVNIYSLPETLQDPNTETTPQIKISAVYSTKDDDSSAKISKHERGMFILKPEEINKKLFQNQVLSETTSSTNESNNNEGTSNIGSTEFGEESCPSTSTEWIAPKDDIHLISDDENDVTDEPTENNYEHLWKDVWIECTNVPNLGWITAIRNYDNLLSFKFPGRQFSDFCSENEAFTKINLELFKRINTSTNLELQWKVTESMDQLKGQELNPEHLSLDYILTQDGLFHTSDTKKSKDKPRTLRTYSKVQLKDKGYVSGSPREVGKMDESEETEESRSTQDQH